LAKYPDFIGKSLNIGNQLYPVPVDVIQMKEITGSSEKVELRLGKDEVNIFERNLENNSIAR
jgi:hypothetical protein